MKLRKTTAVLAATAGVLLGSLVATPAASAGEATRCWLGWNSPTPNHPGNTRAVGEASISCQDGTFAPGVPVLNEKIVRLEIEAVMQMLDPSTGEWVNRGNFVHNEVNRGGTLRVPVEARCNPVLPGTSRVWRVMTTFAVAQEHSPDLNGSLPGIDMERKWEWYGESSRVRELPCG